MKITKRIAEEAYCYTEIEFTSLEEYEKGYPVFAEAMKKMKRKLASTPKEKFLADLDESGDAFSEIQAKAKKPKMLNKNTI